jgi:GTP-binding protein
LLDWFAPTGRPVHVLLTKADKLNRQQATERLREVSAGLEQRYPGFSVQLFSATAKTGLEEAVGVLANWFETQLP